MTPKQIIIILTTAGLMVGSYFLATSFIKKEKASISVTPDFSQVKDESVIDPKEVRDPLVKNFNDGYKLPEGIQVYTMSHGDNVKGPKAQKIVFDPLAAEKGQEQKITVTFPNSEIVTSAVIFINTDTQEKQKVTLRKTEDQNLNTWQGSWTFSDTIENKYNATLYFVGPSGDFKSDMNFL